MDGPEIVGLLIVFSVPIVAMVLHHQRRMAEILHRKSDSQVQDDRIASMQAQIDELRAVVNQAVIRLDDEREFERRLRNGS